MMKILGIDPGLATVGWGIIESDDLSASTTAWGSLATSSRDPLAMRLKKIHDVLAKVIQEHQPQMASVEEVFFAANVKTAVAMAHGRAAAILSLAETGVELFEYSPLQIKQAVVGHGRAAKGQVQLMVRQLLKLKTTPAPDHAADALAAALTLAASLKRRALLGNALAGVAKRRSREKRRAAK
jgi:crossover junction endodeoxyribonuclease RuvC